MKYPFYMLSDEIMKRLQEIKATHYTVTKTRVVEPYVAPYVSIHFYSSAKEVELNNGLIAYNEIAYFLPEMHSMTLGALSGFNEVSRLNGIDGIPQPISTNFNR